VKGTNIDCSHPDDGKRRYAVSWQPATVCKACFDAAAAATRVPSRHVGAIETVFVHGTGLIARKPALDAYDQAL
jgi:hypothetical protein